MSWSEICQFGKFSQNWASTFGVASMYISLDWVYRVHLGQGRHAVMKLSKGTEFLTSPSYMVIVTLSTWKLANLVRSCSGEHTSPYTLGLLSLVRRCVKWYQGPILKSQTNQAAASTWRVVFWVKSGGCCVARWLRCENCTPSCFVPTTHILLRALFQRLKVPHPDRCA